MIAVIANICLFIVFMLVLNSPQLPAKAKLYAWFMMLFIQIAIVWSLLCR